MSNNEQNALIVLIYETMLSATGGYGYASAMAWLYSVIESAIVIFFAVLPKINFLTLYLICSLLRCLFPELPSGLSALFRLQAFQSMDYWKTFRDSVVIAGVPTLINVVICAVVGSELQ